MSLESPSPLVGLALPKRCIASITKALAKSISRSSGTYRERRCIHVCIQLCTRLYTSVYTRVHNHPSH